MRLRNHLLLLTIACILCVPAISQVIEKGGASNAYPSTNAPTINIVAKKETGIEYYPFTRVLMYAEALKLYAKSNDFNTQYAFIINMGMRSSVKRFFVVDLKNNCVIKSGLVAHGKGEEQFTFDRKYSNDAGSNCTSLGKYKIGKAYKGFFGLSYKMHGLEKSNSKAYERNVVLHAMHCIPDNETGKPICQSEGCPSVSDSFLLDLKKIIDGSKKPILLWIYDSTQPVAKTSTKKNKKN
jgi:hypothetical protein